MPQQSRTLDGVFQALADPTRRAVIQRLGRRPASVTELAEPFDMALPSFMQHLQLLEDCKLVRSKKRGRVRTYELTPAPLSAAEKWVSAQRAQWARRLDSLDDYLARLALKEHE